MDVTWTALPAALLAVVWVFRKQKPGVPELDEYWKDREADEEARRGVPYSQADEF